MRIAVIAGVSLWLVALSCYDLRHRRLPNLLTLPGAALIVVGATWAGRGLPALAGALGLGALYLAVHLAAPAGMGAGDVKLALGLGGLAGCFGVEVWFLAAIGAPLLTAAVALLAGRRSVPHGPSMCVASAAVLALAQH